MTTGTVVTLDTIIQNDVNWIPGFDASSSTLFDTFVPSHLTAEVCKCKMFF